jgi:hypothetical protein
VIARCERRIGQELRIRERPAPGPKDVSEKATQPPTLDELGFKGSQGRELAVKYQDMASVEETVLLDAIAAAGAEGREVTKKDIRRVVREALGKRREDAAHGVTFGSTVHELDATRVHWPWQERNCQGRSARVAAGLAQQDAGGPFALARSSFLGSRPGQDALVYRECVADARELLVDARREGRGRRAHATDLPPRVEVVISLQGDVLRRLRAEKKDGYGQHRGVLKVCPASHHALGACVLGDMSASLEHPTTLELPCSGRIGYVVERGTLQG